MCLVCVFVRVDASASPALTRVLALPEALDFCLGVAGSVGFVLDLC